MPADSHPVLAVIGACGGVGSSAFCAALARSRADPAALLMDLDATGGGIDLLLGIEDQAGARWADLRLGGGQLDSAQLAQRLPSWGGASILAASAGVGPTAAEAAGVLAAARDVRPVVVDVPRWMPSSADPVLAAADAAMVVVAAEVRCVVAARRLIEALERDWPEGAGRRLAAVARPGAVGLDAVRAHLGLPATTALPVHDWLGGDDGGALRHDAWPRAIAQVADRAWSWAAGA